MQSASSLALQQTQEDSRFLFSYDTLSSLAWVPHFLPFPFFFSFISFFFFANSRWPRQWGCVSSSGLTLLDITLMCSWSFGFAISIQTWISAAGKNNVSMTQFSPHQLRVNTYKLFPHMKQMFPVKVMELDDFKLLEALQPFLCSKKSCCSPHATEHPEYFLLKSKQQV